MKPTRQARRGEVRPRRGRFGLGRSVAAAPVVLGSLLLLITASVTLGRWAGLLLPLAWAAGTAVLITRVGERMTLRAVCGFRRLGPAEAAWLTAAWAAALRVTGTAAGGLELYVQTARAPNAYAAGGRSVAVTSRVVEDHAAGRLTEGQLVALLVHELGHHATGATRPMLLLAWLTAPWRVTASALARLAWTLAGRHPRSGLSIVLGAGLPVAGIRTVQQGRWMAGGVLLLVGLGAVLGPLANAALSRRSEYAADRFVADHGLATELTAALQALTGGHLAPGGSSRLLSTHPTSEQRINALQTATVAPPSNGARVRHADVPSQEPQRSLTARVSKREFAAVSAWLRASPDGRQREETSVAPDRADHA